MTTPHIALTPLPRESADEVLHFTLPPEQEQFAGPIAELVADDDPNRDFHVLRVDGAAVGFFKVERGYGRSHDFAPEEALGLRMLLIDQARQGAGLGKALFALLPGYLRTRYPGSEAIWLTVNCRNPRARHVYLSGGWTDTGALYHGGGLGPQHIMRLDLG